MIRLFKKLFKKEKKEELIDVTFKTVEALFGIEDNLKYLKLNSLTPIQLENMYSAEKSLNSIIKKLYVPDYQSKNI